MLFIEWNIFVQWNSGKWKLGTLSLCVHIDVIMFPILWLRLHELVFIVLLMEGGKKSKCESHDCYLQFLEKHIRWRTGTWIQWRECNKNAPLKQSHSWRAAQYLPNWLFCLTLKSTLCIQVVSQTHIIGFFKESAAFCHWSCADLKLTTINLLSNPSSENDNPSVDSWVLKYPHEQGLGVKFSLRGNKSNILIIIPCVLYLIPFLCKLIHYFGTQLKCPFLRKCHYSHFN
jgi:hypothetical protein